MVLDPPIMDNDNDDEPPEEIGLNESKQISIERDNLDRQSTRKKKKRKSSKKSEGNKVIEQRVETDEEDSIVQDSLEGDSLDTANDEETRPKKRRVKKMIFPDKTLEVFPLDKLSEANNKLKLGHGAVDFKMQMMSRVKRRSSSVLWEKLKIQRAS